MAQPAISAPGSLPLAPAVRHRTDTNHAAAEDLSPLSLLSMPPKMRKASRGVPLSESFRSSIYSLSANVLRTLLTMLGIIIGVGSVVTLLAIGNGVVADARDAVTRNGTNLVSVTAANASSNGVPSPDSSNSLTLDDANALMDPENCPNCQAISPEVQGGGVISAGSTRTFAPITGILPTYADVHSYNTIDGSFVTDEDVQSNTQVVALGSSVATSLFPAGAAVGKTVRINNLAFRVVGVMETKGGTGFGSQDSRVYVPLPVALARFTGSRQRAVGAGKTVNTIAVKADSYDNVDQTISEITDTMNARHKIRNGVTDFTVVNQADQIKTAQDQQRTQQIFLLVIASVSLLVGGIGIMNIMLVSVTERTREIGVRKAIGAKERDILTQFIMEAVLISFIGAIIGVIIGVSAALIVAATWKRTILDPTSIVVAMAFACAVGLFFGVYPAQRAARLKPIDALRYE